MNKVHLVVDSWAKAHRTSDECKYMSDSYYRKNYYEIIKKILGRSTVIIDFLEGEYEEDGEKKQIIIGWICYEVINGVKVLHYVYIKYDFRKKGYMKKLLKKHEFGTEKNSVLCSFMSYKFKKIMKNSVVFEPVWR